jgi:predicted glycogen debranching enzyme
MGPTWERKGETIDSLPASNLLPMDNKLTTREWLEADGLGGFSSGTASGTRTRRYHALLLPAATPPTGRVALVNGFDAWVDTPRGSFPISSQRYAPGVVHPDGARRIESFTAEPWPRWRFRLEDGTAVEQEIFVPKGVSMAVLSWRLAAPTEGVVLRVRPFLSGRDYHALHRENASFRFDAEGGGGRIIWRPYTGVPGMISLSNGEYSHAPDWYRRFLYDEERARGLDAEEDLASPGVLRWDLSRGPAAWILGVETSPMAAVADGLPAAEFLDRLRNVEEKRRGSFPSRLHRAADAYVVRRGAGKTIVAGYPWFTDWGRDAFIAIRGLLIAAGRLDDARDILLEWARAVSAGMLPNRFTDRGEAPEFNSVDASLWFVVAVHDWLEAVEARGGRVPPGEWKVLGDAVLAIVSGHARGTRFGIRLDADGLLAAGEPGVQLTWMDAKVGDWVVTPRIGKPVEVNALWLNALWIASRLDGRWREALERGRASFLSRFWDDARGHLADVVDDGHRAGAVDASFRPNQIVAVGGLPLQVLDRERARRVVDAVEARLWTPLGLRSLAPGEPGYTPRYEGGVVQRDGAYHQGTVWPWLAGPFVEAWVRVRGGSRAAREEARARFLSPLLEHLDEAGLGHVSEIADAESPHTPRGCPFQAWSVGEALRLDLSVLAQNTRASVPPSTTRQVPVM